MTSRWGDRFLDSTRGQVVQLLRRGEATVNDLARELELTDNAVRAHLTSLERDGLVRQSGKRPGVRKPEALFALTPAAEQLFPKSYHVLIRQLLNVIGDRLSSAEIKELLEEAGRNIAAQQPKPSPDATHQEHLARILALVRDLGGLAETNSENPHEIVGFSCPVGDVAKEHPEICTLIQSLLSEATGLSIREKCDRSSRPRCIFEIG